LIYICFPSTVQAGSQEADLQTVDGGNEWIIAHFFCFSGLSFLTLTGLDHLSISWMRLEMWLVVMVIFSPLLEEVLLKLGYL